MIVCHLHVSCHRHGNTVQRITGFHIHIICGVVDVKSGNIIRFLQNARVVRCAVRHNEEIVLITVVNCSHIRKVLKNNIGIQE